MNNQLVLLHLLLVSCSLLATNATDHCDNLLSHCNQLKTQCSPDMMTLRSCCDLIGLSLSREPSGVYQLMQIVVVDHPSLQLLMFTVTWTLLMEDGWLYKGIYKR